MQYTTEEHLEANRCSISSIEQSSIEQQPDDEEDEEVGFTPLVEEVRPILVQNQIKSQK